MHTNMQNEGTFRIVDPSTKHATVVCLLPRNVNSTCHDCMRSFHSWKHQFEGLGIDFGLEFELELSTQLMNIPLS